jgi:hypothetical protein
MFTPNGVYFASPIITYMDHVFRVAEEMSLQTEPAALSHKTRTLI